MATRLRSGVVTTGGFDVQWFSIHNDGKRAMDVGISPEKLFKERLKMTRFSKSPKASGMLPRVVGQLQQLHPRHLPGGLVAASAFVVFLTSVGSLIFSALALGVAVVCAHGACRVPKDLFLDEPDQVNGGSGNPLLSFAAAVTGAEIHYDKKFTRYFEILIYNDDKLD
ncbi:LOW QUALITY PROTEIN: hypothetical protein U9M48_005648, partial [Paspalum notatum var. saurae]